MRAESKAKQDDDGAPPPDELEGAATVPRVEPDVSFEPSTTVNRPEDLESPGTFAALLTEVRDRPRSTALDRADTLDVEPLGPTAPSHADPQVSFALADLDEELDDLPDAELGQAGELEVEHHHWIGRSAPNRPPVAEEDLEHAETSARIPQLDDPPEPKTVTRASVLEDAPTRDDGADGPATTATTPPRGAMAPWTSQAEPPRGDSAGLLSEPTVDTGKGRADTWNEATTRGDEFGEEDEEDPFAPSLPGVESQSLPWEPEPDDSWHGRSTPGADPMWEEPTRMGGAAASGARPDPVTLEPDREPPRARAEEGQPEKAPNAEASSDRASSEFDESEWQEVVREATLIGARRPERFRPGDLEAARSRGYAPDFSEKHLSMWVHVACALVAVTGVPGFLGGLVVYLLRRRNPTPFFLYHANQAVVFQAICYGAAITAYVAAPQLRLIATDMLLMPLEIFVALLALLYPLLLALYAAQGRWNGYYKVGYQIRCHWRVLLQ